MRISVPLRQDIFDMSKAKCRRCKDLLLFWVVRESVCLNSQRLLMLCRIESIRV